MKPILAIDPGNIQSAYCLIDPEGYKPLEFAKRDNELVRRVVKLYCASKRCEHVVIELIGHYGTGMPAGQTVFDTCIEIGRLVEIVQERGTAISTCKRPGIKAHLCGTPKAKDSNVIQALKDRFGDKGTKKNPGHFYGFSKDIWQAYALGVYWIDTQKEAGRMPVQTRVVTKK